MFRLLSKKLIICVAILGFGILPSFARIEGKISKQHFYDTEKTIMPEVEIDTTLKTGKYWEKNLFYLNKYRPLFMLSNKELFNLMPEKKVNIAHRINAPSVYNISLKASSINTNIPTTAPKKQETKKEPPSSQISDIQTFSLYEQAKNKGADSDKKIDTAILLKETNVASNYNLALDLLDDVTRTEPYNAYAFYIKGEIYSKKKDSENAIKNYAQALKLNPYSKQSCLGIAKILEPTNKSLAQKYYDKAKEVTGNE